MTQTAPNWRPLSDFASIKGGKRMAKGIALTSENTGNPYIRVTDFKDYSIATEQVLFIPAGYEKTIRRYNISTKDVYISIAGTIGVVGQIPSSLEGANLTENAAKICINDPHVHPPYLMYALSSAVCQDQIKQATAKNAQPKLALTRIEQIKVPFPSTFNEQRLIALALSQLHLGTRTHGECIALSLKLKRAAMRALFTKGLRGEAQKDTEIGPVPGSWSVIDFAAVRDWLQYGTSTHCTYEVTAYPVLRIPNIEPGYVSPDDLKYAKLSKSEAERYVLQDGDLIFIRTNGVIERLGACAVYASQPEGALFASYLIRARLKRNRVEPRYVAYFYASDLGTSVVAGRATPAADGKYNLNTGTIDSLPLPLPPTLDEQREIVAVLDAIDRKIDLHKRKRAVFEELFKSLLHKVMTGEIRVADLDLSALAPSSIEDSFRAMDGSRAVAA